MTIKLYRVTTIVKEFDKYKRVPIEWACIPEQSSRPRPYYQLIESCEQMGTILYAFEAIDELFTEEEARTLVTYLVRDRDEIFNSIIPVKLPIPLNSVGLDALRKHNFSLYATPGYPLPFKVQGFPDFDACEPLAPDDDACPF